MVTVPVLQDFPDDAALLVGVLAGIGVVGVDDHGGIFQPLLLVEPVQENQVLIVVVGPGFAVLVGIAP